MTLRLGARGRLRPTKPGKLVSDVRRLVTGHTRLSRGERRKISDVIRHGIWRNFQRESYAGSIPWDPLAQRTIEERRELGFPGEHPILKRTGSLRDSIIDAGHPLHDERWGTFADATVAVVMSNDERIPALVSGDWLQNLPPRPIYLLGPAELNAIGDATAWVIEQKALKGG